MHEMKKVVKEKSWVLVQVRVPLGLHKKVWGRIDGERQKRKAKPKHGSGTRPLSLTQVVCEQLEQYVS